ncbi:MAG: hypothetical protein RI920_129 [Pseudomonadota bacterium]
MKSGTWAHGARGALILSLMAGLGSLAWAGAAAPLKTVAPASPVTPASTKCRSELSPEALDRTAGRSSDSPQDAEGTASADPKFALQTVARQALSRSAAVGASKWLADAATFDVEQVEAGLWPTVSVSASRGPQRSSLNGEKVSGGNVGNLGVSTGGSLYDGGRTRAQIQLRRDLQRAEQFGLMQAGETVVSEAVSTVLDRARYQMQVQVYQQYVRKMACLVDALDAIVASDRGRASELVQARKTLSQAELSRDVAASAVRQVDHKIRKLLGDNFAMPGGVTAALSNSPDLAEMVRLANQSAEVQKMKAESVAAEGYARSLELGRGPQVGWTASRSESEMGRDRRSVWSASVNVNWVVFDAGAEKSAIRAAWARSEASQQQLTDLMDGRMQQIRSLHDTSSDSFTHARQYASILKDSELLRSFTFQQWSQLGRRSLFDLMSAESDHFTLRIAYVNALFDGYAANAQLRSLGGGLAGWISPEIAP